MKHRHSFFLYGPDTDDAFELVNTVLKVRHFQAAREWKATIGTQDIDERVHSVSPSD